MSNPARPPVKLAYTPPRLVTYGDITQLTQTTRRGKRKDGGIKSKARTR